MTDIQILTMAIAVIVPLSLLIYSNSRISDARADFSARIIDSKETLRAEMKTFQAEMNARFDRIEEKMTSQFEHMEMLLKLHEFEHHKK